MANKKQFIEDIRKYGKTSSWEQLAEQYGFSSGEAIRSFYKRNKNLNYIHSMGVEAVKTVEGSKSPVMTEQDTNRETGEQTLTYQSDRPLSPSEIDDLAGVDNITRVVTRTWLKSNKNGIWTYSICTKLVDKSIQTKTDYQTEFLEFLNRTVTGEAKQKITSKYSKEESNNALILSLSDLHLDKKSYFEETGEDSSIIKQFNVAIDAATDLIDRAAMSHHLEKIIIIGGNDFFHANSAANTTQKGTPLDVDGLWNQSFKKGLELITKIIDYAKEEAPVQYITVLGNHSPEREFYLSVALDAYYRNDVYVQVETVNNVRKYFQYGNSAFLLSHEFGNKQKDLPVLFAIEAPQMFADCKYKFVLSGHIHSKNEIMYKGAGEQYGILHKVMPSLSGTDRWHHDNLFIGNQKSCIALVINDTYGEIAELIYNV